VDAEKFSREKKISVCVMEEEMRMMRSGEAKNNKHQKVREKEMQTHAAGRMKCCCSTAVCL
jgi:hypothetical protein